MQELEGLPQAEKTVHTLISDLMEAGHLQPAEGEDPCGDLEGIYRLLADGAINLDQEIIGAIISYLSTEAKKYDQLHKKYVTDVSQNKGRDGDLEESMTLYEGRNMGDYIKQKEKYEALAQKFQELIQNEDDPLSPAN